MSTKQDFLERAGDVNIESLTLYRGADSAVNMTNMVESIVIYEDLFSPFITGTVAVRDTLDLPNSFGRAGNDVLVIKMSTPTLDKKYSIDGEFIVYKMSDRTMTAHRTQVYNLFFASIEMFTDLNTRISRKFVGTGDEIFDVVCRKYLKTKKPLNSNASINRISFVSNFWSPTKSMVFVTEHAQAQNMIPSHMFYENRDGFNFLELSALSDSRFKPIQTFNESDYSADIGAGKDSGKANISPGKTYSNINALRVDVSYDYARDYLDGAIQTKQYSVDLVTKSLKWSTFSIRDLDKNGILNSNRLYTDQVIGDSTPLITLVNRTFGVLGLGDSSNYLTLQARIAYLRSLQSSKIEIDVFGRFDYTVGKKVYVGFTQNKPISKADDNSEIRDNVLSGFYIITAVAHRITREIHESTLELCKDSTGLK
jgi:hypothetical protein